MHRQKRQHATSVSASVQDDPDQYPNADGDHNCRRHNPSEEVEYQRDGAAHQHDHVCAHLVQPPLQPRFHEAIPIGDSVDVGRQVRSCVGDVEELHQLLADHPQAVGDRAAGLSMGFPPTDNLFRKS